jgi:predicted patatin/cPLA2 family phospholipase
VKTVTPLRAAIDAGADDIHVIMTPPQGSQPTFDPDPTTLDAALRTVELMNDQIIEDDLKKAMLWNKLIEHGIETPKRRINITVIRPRDVLNDDSLKFDPDEAARLQNQGYRDALEAFDLN